MFKRNCLGLLVANGDSLWVVSWMRVCEAGGFTYSHPTHNNLNKLAISCYNEK